MCGVAHPPTLPPAQHGSSGANELRSAHLPALGGTGYWRFFAPTKQASGGCAQSCSRDLGSGTELSVAGRIPQVCWLSFGVSRRSICVRARDGPPRACMGSRTVAGHGAPGVAVLVRRNMVVIACQQRRQHQWLRPARAASP